MAKVICPNCGSEVILPEHSTFCSGMSISEETRGTFVLPMKETKGESNMINETVKGETTMVGMDEATMAKVKAALGEDAFNAMMIKMNRDPILHNIVEHGDLECGVDFHRWVLKQMLEIQSGWHGYTRAMNCRYDYMYQFEDYLRKINNIIDLRRKGKIEAANIEEKFVSTIDVISLCNDYMKKLKEQVQKMDTHNCKGIKYVIFKGEISNKYLYKKEDYMMFVSDIEKKVYKPIEKIISKMNSASSFNQVSYVLSELIRFKYFLTVSRRTKKEPAWVNNFKGYGAYFSLKDSIRFFGVQVTEYKTGRRLSREESLSYLDEVRYECSNGDNYKMLALLEKSWKDSNFNFATYRSLLNERK